MSDQKFIKEALAAHNQYRATHQAPPIAVASDLNSYAQNWANHIAKTGQFAHSDCNHRGGRLGENIAMKWSSQPTAYSGQDATDQWYSEVKVHQFGVEPRSLSSGHFTQVVWKGSKEFGIGKATTSDGKIYVVASYRPAGNMSGDFTQNVLPPKDGKVTLPPENKPQSNNIPVQMSRGGCSGDSGRPSRGGESKSVRTFSTTENGVTKTITEETIIRADGSKVTNRKETTTSAGSGSNNSTFEDTGFKQLSLHESQPQRESPRSSQSQTNGSTNKPQRMSEFIDDVVKVHNTYRSKHGVSSVAHASDMSDHAQRWAEHLAATNSFQHSQCILDGGRLGENIACKWSSGGADYSANEVVEQWYSEISKHDFKNNSPGMGTGHFTQVVWKNSKEVGIGKSRTANGKVIVVANYRPAGNLLGHYIENVFPAKK